MVITILEAKVEAQQWEKIADTFKKMTKQVPPEIINTYLTQSQSEISLWRIITVWKDQSSLDAMRSSGETPTGVLIFQIAGAKPSLTIFDVIESK